MPPLFSLEHTNIIKMMPWAPFFFQFKSRLAIMWWPLKAAVEFLFLFISSTWIKSLWLTPRKLIKMCFLWLRFLRWSSWIQICCITVSLIILTLLHKISINWLLVLAHLNSLKWQISSLSCWYLVHQPLIC